MFRLRVVALLLPLSLAACPGGPPCDQSTCAGCCDPNNFCQPGNAAAACGANGFLCIECPLGYSCENGTCIEPPSCRPITCESVGKNCGQLPDGCGGVLECGTCSGGDTCGGAGTANVCGPGTCNPRSCAMLGAQCGPVSDGCATVLQCGSCPQGENCGGGGPNKCGTCAPQTCTQLQRNCGLVADGCGGMVSCGTCTVPGESCGGGGTANVCGSGGCVPKTCAEVGAQCGEVNDGCGNTMFCGNCSGFATCGGAGMANVCGAVCSAGCPNGFNCNAMGVCAGGSLMGLTLNEVGHAVSGVIRVNGAAPVLSNPAYCQDPGNVNDAIAAVRFTDATRGYSASVNVTCTSGFAFSALLPPGTYEVRVERATYSTSAGINLMPVSYLANPSLTVSGPTSGLVLDEVGHSVSGVIRVNGAAPVLSNPTYCQDPGNVNDAIAAVRFTDSSKGYSATVNVTCTSQFGFSTLLPPGTYQVRVERATYSTSAGINLMPVSYLANPSLTVSAPVSGLVLDEVGHTVSGVIRVNGAAPVLSNPTYCQDPGNVNDAIAAVRFIDSSKGYSATVNVTCTSQFGFSTLLPPGTYEVRIDRATYSTSAGINLMPVSYLANPSLTVSAPVSGLVLDEVGHTVSGVIRVNGAAPVLSNPTYCQDPGNVNDAIAAVRFIDSSKGYSATVNVTCTSQFGFSTLLPPGTYQVRVERATYSTSAGINLMPVSYLANPALTVSGATSGLVLDEVGHTVSGVIRVNGAAPVLSNPTYCQDPGNVNDAIAAVRFTDATRGYSATVNVTCTSQFGFSTLLPPGTYQVRVERATYSTSAGINLLPVSYLANPALSVSGPTNGLVLDEVGRTVSGVIRVNGAPPVLSNPTYCQDPGNVNDAIAAVRFTDSAKGYNATANVTCTSGFGFSVLLPPGTYQVRIERATYSTSAGINLLPVSYEAITRLEVP